MMMSLRMSMAGTAGGLAAFSCTAGAASVLLAVVSVCPALHSTLTGFLTCFVVVILCVILATRIVSVMGKGWHRPASGHRNDHDCYH